MKTDSLFYRLFQELPSSFFERKARVVQEDIAEGKLEVVPHLQQRGLTVEDIADIVGLTVEQVRQAIADSEKPEE